ncbi:hypothetical protein HaLaN_13939, partial [Haematococcus lacustris]
MTYLLNPDMKAGKTGSDLTWDAAMLPSHLLGDLCAAGALRNINPYIVNNTGEDIAWSDLPAYGNLLSSRFNQQVNP